MRWFKRKFVSKEYIKLYLDGTGCIMTPAEAVQLLIDDSGTHDYTYQSVFMTEEEYESLPEFQGF